MSKQVRHFLEVSQYDTETLTKILDNADAMKKARIGHPRGEVEPDAPLAGKVLAMVFEKPSTRTRVSFDVAMRQMGGQTLVLSSAEMQLGRGETVADTAKILSGFVDGIMIRTFGDDKLQELAAHATVPVINALTDFSHPCQIMADMQTLREVKGDLGGLVVAWSGDANNVANSWIHAAGRFGFELRIAAPEELQPSRQIMDWANSAGAKITVTDKPEDAVTGVDCVVTDTWESMGDEPNHNLHNMLQPYQVDQRLMDMARPDAIFMHCLPAHRGEEVTAQVIDGPQSVVFAEAENRLHAQKAVLGFCMADDE